MMFKKIYVTTLLLSVALVHAAASSSKTVASFDEVRSQDRQRQLHNMLQEAVFSKPEDHTALNRIIAWRAEGNEQFFNMSDKNGVKPLFWARSFMDKLPGNTLTNNSEYYARIMQALDPMTEQSSENKEVSNFMDALLRGDKQQYNDACLAFAGLPADQQASIREQYLVETGGHYIEPVLMKDNIRAIIRVCIAAKAGASGFEKIYAIGLLKYMLSPLYHKSVSSLLLNSVLLCCALKEQGAPSFVPALMRAKANPCEMLMLENNQKSSALRCILKRLIHRPLERGHATRLLFEMLPSVPKDDRIGVSFALGRFGQNLTEGDYMQHWRLWIDICATLGVNLKKLRCLVFPVLKHTIANRSEYRSVKTVRNEVRLSDIEKFAFACLIQEFAHMLASSLVAHVVYDLSSYIEFGEIIIVREDEDIKSIRTNAERYRAELTGKANELVDRIVKAVYKRN